MNKILLPNQINVFIYVFPSDQFDMLDQVFIRTGLLYAECFLELFKLNTNQVHLFVPDKFIEKTIQISQNSIIFSYNDKTYSFTNDKLHLLISPFPKDSLSLVFPPEYAFVFFIDHGNKTSYGPGGDSILDFCHISNILFANDFIPIIFFDCCFSGSFILYHSLLRSIEQQIYIQQFSPLHINISFFFFVCFTRGSIDSYFFDEITADETNPTRFDLISQNADFVQFLQEVYILTKTDEDIKDISGLDPKKTSVNSFKDVFHFYELFQKIHFHSRKQIQSFISYYKAAQTFDIYSQANQYLAPAQIHQFKEYYKSVLSVLSNQFKQLEPYVLSNLPNFKSPKFYAILASSDNTKLSFFQNPQSMPTSLTYASQIFLDCLFFTKPSESEKSSFKDLLNFQIEKLENYYKNQFEFSHLSKHECPKIVTHVSDEFPLIRLPIVNQSVSIESVASPTSLPSPDMFKKFTIEITPMASSDSVSSFPTQSDEKETQEETNLNSEDTELQQQIDKAISEYPKDYQSQCQFIQSHLQQLTETDPYLNFEYPTDLDSCIYDTFYYYFSKYLQDFNIKYEPKPTTGWPESTEALVFMHALQTYCDHIYLISSLHAYQYYLEYMLFWAQDHLEQKDIIQKAHIYAYIETRKKFMWYSPRLGRYTGKEPFQYLYGDLTNVNLDNVYL